MPPALLPRAAATVAGFVFMRRGHRRFADADHVDGPGNDGDLDRRTGGTVRRASVGASAPVGAMVAGATATKPSVTAVRAAAAIPNSSPGGRRLEAVHGLAPVRFGVLGVGCTDPAFRIHPSSAAGMAALDGAFGTHARRGRNLLKRHATKRRICGGSDGQRRRNSPDLPRGGVALSRPARARPGRWRRTPYARPHRPSRCGSGRRNA